MRPKGIKDRGIGEIWFSPLGIYKHLNRLSKKVGAQAIEKNGKLKPVREARITAIAALAMFIMRKEIPTYIQISAEEDSPFDSYICQREPGKKGTLLISNIQVTSYREGSKEDFLTQLKRTKVPSGYSIFPKECVVIVDLLTREPFNDEELVAITKYLNENKTPFPVWTFRAISITPETVGEMIILNPELRVFPAINFGKVAYRFKELGYPDAVRIEWVPNEKQLREDEHTGVISEPPWSPAIEVQ